MTDDRHADDGDDGVAEHRARYAPTWSDRLTTLRYTLWPTRYVDEHSDTTDLLWQQVLEQRGIRSWLAVLTTTLLVGGGLLLVALLVLVLMLGGR